MSTVLNRTIRLFEHVASATGSSGPRVDRAAGVILGVKVLGKESANGRTYSESAMRDAARLYEGARVNIDHDRKEPYRERGLTEEFGTLKNVRLKPSGVYADLYFVRSHPLAEFVAEKAERFPDKLGLSHNADGEGRRQGDRYIVESIRSVNSVDLVLQPATNRGLFESRGGHYPGRAAMEDALREADRGVHFGPRTRRLMESLGAAGDGTAFSDDVLAQFDRLLPESMEGLNEAYEAAALELVRLERTPGDLAECIQCLAQRRVQHEGEIERRVELEQSLPDSDRDREAVIESVTRELDRKRGRRTSLKESASAPLESYPATTEEFKRAMRYF